MLSRAQDRKDRWREISALMDRLDRRGMAGLTVPELKRLCHLYRQVAVDLSQARTAGDDPELVRYLNGLAARAHGRVYRSEKVDLRPLAGFVARGFPRLVRRHARAILVATGVFLLTTLASFLAVVRSPELAYSLFDEKMVEFENLRLESHQGEYRGNFTFDAGQSPLIAAVIIANNVRVAMLAFGLGSLCCVPGILLLSYNGRMLGTLSGLIYSHGFLLGFYSLILCHGVLELTAICVSGGSGLLLGWALISPGGYTRRDVLRRAAPDSFGLLGGCILLLLVAGVIEAYVTPHFPAGVRWTVALFSALFLVVYFGFAGRGSPGPATELRIG